MKVIKLYIKRGCPWCVELENFMRENKINFELIEVLASLEKFNEMIEISGQSKAPVVVIGDEIFADTDKETMQKIFKEKKII